VLGHEIGHLVFGHTTDPALELISYFQELAIDGGTQAQKILRRPAFAEAVDLAHIVSQLSELNADRVGLLFAGEFASAKAAMKLATGYGDKFGEYDLSSFTSQAKEILRQDFTEDDIRQTHPYGPLRVYALKTFSESEFMGGKKKLQDFSELLPNLVPLSHVSGTPPRVPISPHAVGTNSFEKELFKTLAAIDVATADGKATRKECDYISNMIRDPDVYALVDGFIASASEEDLVAKYAELAPKVASLGKREKRSLVRVLIKLAKADRKLSQTELDAIAEIAVDIQAQDICQQEICNVLGSRG
jgi:uncharacterized tellurite resistance protein B-like protein